MRQHLVRLIILQSPVFLGAYVCVTAPSSFCYLQLFEVATAAGASEILSDEDANGVAQGFKVDLAGCHSL